MERYSEYKDSGVKWLGEIPSHWKLLKSKYLWKETFENSTSGKEDLLSVSQYTGVTKSKGDSRSESLVGYKIVHKDDLVINIMLAWLGGLGVSNDEGIVSPAYCTYKLVKDNNPKFLHYLYKTPMYLAEFARHSTGVVPSRWRMYTDDFGQVISLLPPVAEQDAIVRYLDATTSKIDKAIAMQQKMIDLLNERKQIIIQNAVTKGLDEKVEMKDSGVEWIGMIPKHWEIGPFKRLIKIKNGADYKKYEVQENGYPVIGSGGVFAYSSKYSYDGEALLLGRKGTIDKPLYFKGKFWTVDTMFYGIPKDNADCKYLYYQALIIPFKMYATATAIPSMTQTDLYNNPMCIPCKKEQKAIADYLDSAIKPFDSAISNCQRQISLLQERKQIIINEVVTGKVKVS